MATKIETLKKPNGDQVLPRTRAKAVSMENGTTVEAAIADINTAIDSLTNVSEYIDSHNVSVDSHSDIRESIESLKDIVNNKSDFSGSYNDLTNKPDIPLIEGLASEEYVDGKINELVESGGAGKVEISMGDVLLDVAYDNFSYDEGMQAYFAYNNENGLWDFLISTLNITSDYVEIPVIVEFDGNIYNTTLVYNNDTMFGTLDIRIGNLGFLPDSPNNTGEPFLIMVLYGGDIAIFAQNEGNSHSIVINPYKDKIYSIDPKFLPEGGFGYSEISLKDAWLEATWNNLTYQDYVGGYVGTIEKDGIEDFFRNKLDIVGDYAEAPVMVEFDGKLYRTKIVYINDWMDGSMIFIGNAYLYSGHRENTGEPFVILLSGNNAILIIREKGDSHSCVVGPEKIYKIDEKFLPDSIATKDHVSDKINEKIDEFITNKQIGAIVYSEDVLAETELTFNSEYPNVSNAGVVTSQSSLRLGETYYVRIELNDGSNITYTEICKDSMSGPILGDGNIVNFGETMGSDGQFGIYQSGEETIILTVIDNAKRVVVYTPSETIHKIDEKFIPDTVASKSYVDERLDIIPALNVDATLSKEGFAADAKAVGDALASFSGGSSGAGIIDVLELPTEDINTGAFYRLMTAKWIHNGEEVQNGSVCYCVNTLPELGQVVTDVNMNLFVGYYVVTYNEVYGYVDETLGSGFGVPAGWYPFSTLSQVSGLGFNGIVTDIEDLPDDNSYFGILLTKDFYIYQDGWCKLPFACEKDPKFDITWDGDMTDRQAIDMSMLGYAEGLYYVKVSDDVFTTDEVLGWTINVRLNDGSYEEYITDEWSLDTESFPGAFTIDGYITVLYDADATASALGIPVGIYTNGIYFWSYAEEGFVSNFTSPCRITKIDEKYLPNMGVDVDSLGLHSVATSGNYNDLWNKPNLNNYVLTSNLTNQLSNYVKRTEVETMISNAIGSAIGGSY